MPSPTPDPSDLTDLTSVESYLKLDSSTLDAQLLQDLITAISQAAATYTSRTFMAQADITEVRNGNGQDRLSFLTPPVFAVSSLSINNTSVQAAQNQTDSGFIFDSDFIYLRGGLSVSAPLYFGPARFDLGKRNVSMVLSCGYSTPGQSASPVSGAPKLPLDLKMMTTQWVALAYRQSKRVGDKSIGEGPQRHDYVLDALPPFAQLVLDRYIRVAPVEV